MTASDKPHVIRLRGPWQWAFRSPPGDHGCPEVQTGELRLPACLNAKAQWPELFRGRFEMRRQFNWPEQLSYRESLWAVVTKIALKEAWIELNGEALGRIEPADALPAAWDISQRVAKHNELRLIWELDAARARSDELWLDVQLEVRLDVGAEQPRRGEIM